MASAESVALADQKNSLRRAIGEKRSRLTPDERARAVAAATDRLTALPELRAAAERGACVAGFAAMRAEIDPAAALGRARAAGARVALPRVTAPSDDGPRLRFHLATPGDLQPGRFGIAEPDASCPEIQAGDVAVMIVPGLAFDEFGHRLGFGGGYYDEVLSGGPGRRPPFVVGLGYDFQIVPSCPADEHDAQVDCVVTDARVIRCAGTGEVGR